MGKDDKDSGSHPILAADGKNYAAWRQALIVKCRSKESSGYILSHFVEQPYLRHARLDSTETQTRQVLIEPSVASSATAGGDQIPPAPPGPQYRDEDYTIPVTSAGEAVKYSVAKNRAYSYIYETIHDSLKAVIAETDPWKAMDLLHDKFRPAGEDAIQNIIGKLNALKFTPGKQHPYYAAMKYFEQVDQISTERFQIDKHSFTETELLGAVNIALRLCPIEKIKSLHHHYRLTLRAYGDNVVYGELRNFIQSELLQDKNEEETISSRQRSAGDPVAKAAFAGKGNAPGKRGRADSSAPASSDKLAPKDKHPPKKRSHQDLKGKDKGVDNCSNMDPKQITSEWTVKPCSHCAGPGHCKRECQGYARGDNPRSTYVPFSQREKKTLVPYVTGHIARVFKVTYSSRLSSRSPIWYLDSGATDWICNSRESFVTYTPFDVPRPIILGDGSHVDAEGSGTIVLETPQSIITLRDAIYSSKMMVNLISIRRLTEKGIARLSFEHDYCEIISNNEIYGRAVIDNEMSLYRLEEHHSMRANIATQSTSSDFVQIRANTLKAGAPRTKPSLILQLYHRKLGHLHLAGCRTVLKALGIKVDDPPSEDDPEEPWWCEPCIFGKQTQSPNHAPATQRAEAPYELIHIDTNGPWATPTLEKRHAGTVDAIPHRSNYTLVLVDDYSGEITSRFYSSRTQFRVKFIQFVLAVEARGHRVKRVRLDRAKEFISEEIQEFCLDRGIVLEPSASYAHEQNGRAERTQRTVRGMASTILIESGLPEGFWGEAWRTATYLRNRCPTNRTQPESLLKNDSLKPNDPPRKILTGKPVKYDHLHPFGSLVYVTVPPEKQKKVLSQHRAWKGILLGYTRTEKQYRIWNLSKKCIEVARDVVIIDGIMPARDHYDEYFPSWKKSHQSGLQLERVKATDEELACSQKWEETLLSSSSSSSQLVSGAEDAPPVDEEPTRKQPRRKVNAPPRRVLESVEIPIRNHSEHGSLPSDHQSAPCIMPTDTASTSLPAEPPSAPRRMRGRPRKDQSGKVPTSVMVSKHASSPLTLSKHQKHFAWHARITAYDTSLRNPSAPRTEMETLEEELCLEKYIPKSYKEAMNSHEADHWREAVQQELASMSQNGTWNEVSLIPSGTKIMTARWVFTRKHDGRYKARLVIRGFEQRYGIHYTKTYAPVVNLRTVRVLLALVAYADLELHQMDVKTAFLNSSLPEPERVYMNVPEGYHGLKDTVALYLLKSLYGLKQAPLLWNLDLHSTLTSENFPVKLSRSYSDECLYVGEDLIIGIYVDDLIMISRSISVISAVKAHLKAKYEMTDLGEAKKFLSLRITRDRSRRLLRIDQSEYCKKILSRSGMDTTKKRKTPMPPGFHLLRELHEGKASPSLPPSESDVMNYKALLGSILYPTQGSRPDLSFVCGRLGQISPKQPPSKDHWDVMFHAYCYLHETVDYGLLFDGNKPFGFEGYTDADWAENYGENARHSTSGFTWQICGASVSWLSKLQPTIATSSMMAEVIAANKAAEEGLWLRKLLLELHQSGLDVKSAAKLNESTRLWEDNQGAIIVSTEPGNQQRTKAYDVKYFKIRELIREGHFDLQYIKTDDMVADIFTKALPVSKLQKHVESLGLRRCI